MTRDQIVMLLINFFYDEYADDPKGVGYWFSQNYNGDVAEFIKTIEEIKSKKGKPD